MRVPDGVAVGATTGDPAASTDPGSAGTVIALCSARGAPGVSTLALALLTVWPRVHPGRRVLLLDADPAGGSVIAGYLRGQAASGPGIATVAADRGGDPLRAIRNALLAIDAEATQLVLVGMPDGNRSGAIVDAWNTVATTLATMTAPGAGVDVLADLGRLGHQHAASGLLQAADRLVLVVGSGLPDVVAARAAAATLRSAATSTGEPGCVVVNPDRPYPADEVALSLGLDLFGTVPHDERAARMYSHGEPGRGAARRSALLRAVAVLARSLRPAPPDDATDLGPAAAPANGHRTLGGAP